MTTTKEQEFQAFCNQFQYFSFNQLELDKDGNIVNIDSLLPDHTIPPEVPIVYHEDVDGVLINPDGNVVEIHDDHFYVHIANQDTKSNSLIHIYLELFAFSVGCSEAWFDAMLRIDNERIELANNIQQCDKNGHWADINICFHYDMELVTLSECLEWLNNNCD